METEYEARQQEWAENYQDFEADDVVRLILEAGERLAEVCLDDCAVDKVMRELHSAFELPNIPAEQDGDQSWRGLWAATRSIDSMDLPLAQMLTSLNAYAFFGLAPTPTGVPCDILQIKEIVQRVRQAVGLTTIPIRHAEIERTVLAAEARLAIDEGMPLGPEPLSALARVGIKSARNAFAPSSGSGLSVKDGMASAQSARNWLIARGEFKSSIWKHAVDPKADGGPVEMVDGAILWVPFAKDGTAFHPQSCLRSGKYTVGPKGAEQSVENYDEALDRLSRMRPNAYWRRPNSVGNWGIVTAVGFRPYTKEELADPAAEVRT